MVRVTKQAEARHVGGATNAQCDGCATCNIVEFAHRCIQYGSVVGSKAALLRRGCEQTCTKRFGQHESIADDCVRVAEHSQRMHAPSDGQTVLQLFVDDRVSANNDRAGFVDLVLSAAKNVSEDCERELPRRKALPRSIFFCAAVFPRYRTNSSAKRI